MEINVPLLARAIERLNEGLQRYQQDTNDAQIRDGLIQRFEFTYELSLKTLRRYFEKNTDSWEQIRSMNFENFIRHSWGEGFLQEDITQWRIFREARNITSHTYHEDKAIEVCAIIPRFLTEAQYLHAAILQRQQSDESNNPP